MSPKVKELKEKRGQLASEMLKLVESRKADGSNWTAENEAAWKKSNADYDALTQSQQMQERADALEAETRSASPGRQDVTATAAKSTEETRSLALQGWCLHQAGRDEAITEEHRQASAAIGVNFDAKELVQQLPKDYRKLRRAIASELRGSGESWNSTTSGDGGQLIPQGFVFNLEKAMLSFDGAREACDIMRTATGNDMPWPTSNDTANAGELLGENTAAAEANVPTNNVIFKAYKFGSKIIRVSNELMQDSAFALAQFLGETCGERIGRAQNTYFATGSGNSQPQGIVTGSTLGVTAALSQTFTADEMFQLLYSIDPSYRHNGCGWMMHNNVLLKVRLMKDTTNRPLWMPFAESGLSGAQPDMIAGFPYFLNQAMASSVASASKPIIFGQLKKYKIRDAGEIRLMRLAERYAEYDQTAFVAFLRSDAHLMDAGTHPVKHLVMATGSGS